jgi:hypothetical protein
MSDEKLLNLDELFGQAQTVRIRWKGQEYGLLRMEGISPKQLTEFNKLYLRAMKMREELAAENQENNEQLSGELEELLGQILKLLCPGLSLETMPFIVRLRTVTYYVEQTQGKKVLETALKQTGATRSAA